MTTQPQTQADLSGNKYRRTGSSNRWLTLLLVAAGLTLGGTAIAEDLFTKPGLKLAIAGDSITEQKMYSQYIELYLTVCAPGRQVHTMQYGWGGERAANFAGRMDNDLSVFDPNVVTLCYGMNDGGYRAFEPAIGDAYEKPLRDIVARLAKKGVTVVVGSPGAVDTKYFTRVSPDIYNDNLAHLRDLARKVAEDNKMPFANVHDAMIDAMAKAKAVLGADYDVCGRDGVHPGANGHLAMAYAFLKAMGCTGDIGTITLDMNGAESTATAGHRVLSKESGKLELESSRYPFCFNGDEKSGTRSILPYLPFNQDLNRLTLVVKNLKAERADVAWGTWTKSFDRAQLEKGINLAAEFAEHPFTAPFAQVEKAVAAKQNYETPMIKQCVTAMPRMAELLTDDATTKTALEEIRGKLWVKQAKLAADARAAFVPVKHTLVVTPK